MVKIGYKSYVGFSLESSLGAGAAPTAYLEFNSEGFNKEIDEILIDAINGTAQYKRRVTGTQKSAFSLEYPAIPGADLKLFRLALGGSVTTTTLTAGVFQHVFLARTGDLNSLSAAFQVARDTGDTTSVINYVGCKIGNMSFKMGINDVLRVSMDGMGTTESYANTVSTASYRTPNPYVFKNATIKIGDSLATATTTSLDGLSVMVGNNLLEDYAIGSATRNLIEGGMMDVTFEVVKRFDDNGLYNRFLNGTKSYITATYTSDSITSVYNHSIQFEAFNCYFNGAIGNVGGAGELNKATHPVRAIFEDASVSSLRITIISDNTTTS